ncbi:MAG: hypothetical protein QM396_01680 [Euryarchaeota archaeon]|nr:hypothetical protein [Euryarchaeota archaeon]HHT19067.1 hypothetical protein [Methanobacterium sp.]
MQKLYKVHDFLDDESVDKFMKELIEENYGYLRAKYRQILNIASKARNKF